MRALRPALSAAGHAHVPPDLARDPLARSVEIVALGLADDGLRGASPAPERTSGRFGVLRRNHRAALAIRPAGLAIAGEIAAQVMRRVEM